MVPYSYNMVDMGGVDLAEANGTVVPGVYEKIVEAMNPCGDLILYNLKFAEICIAPSAYTVLQQAHSILINGLIQVTELDQITVIGLPPPLVPVSPLNVTENGLYEAEPPASGFNPIAVSVNPPLTSLRADNNGAYTPPEGFYGFSSVDVEVPSSEACIYTKGSTKPMIDTGVPCNTEGLRVVLRLTIPTISSDTGIFGGVWGYNGFLLIMYAGTLRFHSKSSPSFDVPISSVNVGLFSENVVECTKDHITVNDNTYQMTGSGQNTSETLKLFSVSSHYTSEIGVYSLDIYGGNELIRSFTPAYIDGEACLYDSITEQYFYNIGENEIYYN